MQDFILNNQPDALIIQILFCYKTLHVSGNLFGYHQEFSTVHLALVSFVQVFDDHFQAESGWNWRSSRGCPKHVEFYNRIKFGLVRLVGYLKRDLLRCMVT
jgi:hypothetical protein